MNHLKYDFYKTLMLVVSGIAVTGCAGLHSVPPAGYSTVEKDTPTTIVAFDEFGNIYPLSPPNIIPSLKSKIGRNAAFNLEVEMKNIGQPYTTETQNETYDKIVKQIENNAKQAGEGSKIIFLIHGYNNSFKKGSDSYSEIKKLIDAQSKTQNTYVEIYWDGLMKGPYTFKIPYWYWGDAMLNSNYVGQVGLRKLINKLPQNTEMNVITHSRGAGVIFSAISDPEYDKNYKPQATEKFKKDNLKKLRIISIAPAIGSGHVNSDMKDQFPEDTKIFIGFNSKDLTLRKFSLHLGTGNYLMGDTSMGNNNKFYSSLEQKWNSNRKLIQRVKYNSFCHGINKYIDNKDKTNCLLWGANLIDNKPKNCEITQ